MSNLHILRRLRHRPRQNQASSLQTNQELDDSTSRRRHQKVYERGLLEDVMVNNEKCKFMCRFSIQEIYQITGLLGLEEALKFPGISASRQVGFAMLACRYSYPRRYGDMENFSQMDRQNIGKVCRGMENLLFNLMKYGAQFNIYQFREENLKRFAAATDEAGALLPNVVGFIDGTLQQVSRPSTDDDMQRSVYNCWKHVHAIKYQSIVTPDGITSSIMGPFIGSSHDITMVKQLDTERRLQRHLHISDADDDNYAIYGDPAYTLSEHLYRPFPSTTTDPLEIRCNKSMAKVRIAVEWEFAEVMKYFTFCKFKYAMKIDSNNPAKVYMMHCARRGGYPTFSKFKVAPPTLEEYIQYMA